MIKKKLLFVGSLLGVMIFLTCCLEKGGNRTTSTDLAVIDNDPAMGGLVMNTANVTLAAPELASTELKSGDCIMANFTIDYDNQPFSYLTATELIYQLLNNSVIQLMSEDAFADEYTDSISGINLTVSPYYKGNLFAQIERKITNSKICDFQLFCNPDSVDENGVYTVSLKLNESDKTAGEATNYNVESFNLNPLLSFYGQDTIFDAGTSYEQRGLYVTLNFRYQSGTKEDLPVYSWYSGNPVKVFVFK
jgi:hypothetical protein